MSRVVVVNHVTLDGVMQAPGRPDEDMRDGFLRGGWAVPYGDAVMGRAMAQGMANGGALLFGRRTYEDRYCFMGPEYEAAIARTENTSERDFLRRRLQALDPAR